MVRIIVASSDIIYPFLFIEFKTLIVDIIRVQITFSRHFEFCNSLKEKKISNFENGGRTRSKKGGNRARTRAREKRGRNAPAR